nr:acetyltransferase [Vibrio cholerae]
MVTVVVFEFCVMRCQPLRRALLSLVLCVASPLGGR